MYPKIISNKGNIKRSPNNLHNHPNDFLLLHGLVAAGNVVGLEWTRL